MFSNKSVFVLVAICLIFVQMYFSAPIMGDQTEFEDNSKRQGKSKPIYIYCDEVGNHLNCMLYCKSMGHISGTCGGDFICNCF